MTYKKVTETIEQLQLENYELRQRLEKEEHRKSVENALRDSEERYRNLFTVMPSGVAVYEVINDGNDPVGKDFIFKDINPAGEKIVDVKREEIIGKSLYDFFPNVMEMGLTGVFKSVWMSGVPEYYPLTRYIDNRISLWLINYVWKVPSGELVALFYDITESKKVEEKLRESESRYKELVTNARSMILKFDNDANFTFINDYALEFFGYQLNELLGKSVMMVVPKVESTGRDLDEMVDNIIGDPDKYSVNINENVKKNGEKVWVEWHNKTLFDKSGIKTGHLAIGTDITKRRNAEENLKKSERKLRSVLNATLESVYMFDSKGFICMANSTGIKRLNRNSDSEVVGHHFSEFMNQELTKKRLAMNEKVINTGKPLEFEDESDNRTYYHNFYPVHINDKVQFVVTYSMDITERKNAELKLKQSEDRLRSIAESLTVLISITRIKDRVIVFSNEPFLKAFGFKQEDIIGKEYPDIFVYPEDQNTIQDILNEKEIINNKELKLKKTDGSHFWIITSIRKITYMGDASYLASAIDITETKKTAEELLRLNRTLNAHSKSSQAMLHSENEFSYLNEVCKIIIKDCGHSMVWVGYAQNDKNKTVSPVAYYGFDKGYIDQLNITWDDSESGRGPTGTAIRTCRPSLCKNMKTDPRFELWRDAATARGFASSLVLPLVSDGKAFGSVSIYSKEPDSFSDSEIDLLNDLADDLAHGISYIRLTESERAAARVIKENETKLKELVITKDKFFNIIAHDLKNPFTSLLGSTELLYYSIDQMTKENVKELALILNDSAKGGYAILQNLLDWSRSQTGLLRYCPSEINLRSIIDENIDNFALQASNKEITLKTELKADKFIFADKNMINTVLRNLLSNAIKFTHTKGSVTVNSDIFSDEIVLSINDTGVGMSQDKIDQLFQLDNSISMPGTHKEQGTGLGLKLCKEFTEVMGGRIWVESEPGKGSRFCFTIPLKTQGTGHVVQSK